MGRAGVASRRQGKESGRDGITMDIIEEDCLRIAELVSLDALKNKRVLVTGANGFLGQYVVSAIYFANATKKLNCKVVCVGLHAPSVMVKEYIKDKNISFKKVDLSKPFRIEEKFDYIFHAAGYGQPSKFVNDPWGTIAVNIAATRILLEVAARSKGAFVFFSSAETYGEMPANISAFKETYTGAPSTAGPRAVYGASKKLGEALALSFAKQHGVRVRVVRISHVYGPGAPANDTRVLSDFIRKAREQGIIRLLDQGKAVKTYGYIADVTAMILFAALHGKEEIYNVGGKDTISIRELAERVGKYCRAKVEIPKTTSKDYFVGRDPGFVKLDLSKIKKEMKKFAFTSFNTGLANTIRWHQK
jgi:UDP-glucuronate decarboxylase